MGEMGEASLRVEARLKSVAVEIQAKFGCSGSQRRGGVRLAYFVRRCAGRQGAGEVTSGPSETLQAPKALATVRLAWGPWALGGTLGQGLLQRTRCTAQVFFLL